MSFETIKGFYDLGMWTASEIKELVGPDGITPEQFTQITGQPYEVSSTPQTTKSQKTTSSVTTQSISGNSSTQIQENASARG